MKHIVLALFFVASAILSYAQVPTTVTSITDPGTLVNWIAEAQRYAQTIQNAIQELQTADQMLQYQISAVQQLEKGSWQGFVNAWNMETGAINSYANLVEGLPSLSQIQAVSDLVGTQGYKNSVADIKQLQGSWALASNIVHTTDSLVKNTQMRQQLWALNNANSAGSQSTIAQLQALDQALGLLGGEVADVNVNMGSWKDWFVAQKEQQDLKEYQQMNAEYSFFMGDDMSNVPKDSGTVADLDNQNIGASY